MTQFNSRRQPARGRTPVHAELRHSNLHLAIAISWRRAYDVLEAPAGRCPCRPAPVSSCFDMRWHVRAKLHKFTIRLDACGGQDSRILREQPLPARSVAAFIEGK